LQNTTVFTKSSLSKDISALGQKELCWDIA